jgi:hypothetical protein
MYLIDTDVISEIRKGDKANPGVRAFFAGTSRESVDLIYRWSRSESYSWASSASDIEEMMLKRSVSNGGSTRSR